MDDAVTTYLAGIQSPRRRQDAEELIELMRKATGEAPAMWGSIVGFGSYHYRYDSGREGDASAAGFAARKSSLVVYLSDGIGGHQDQLARLGPHHTGVGCLCLKGLGDVDLEVLGSIVARSFAALTAGIYTKRARDGGR